MQIARGPAVCGCPAEKPTPSGCLDRIRGPLERLEDLPEPCRRNRPPPAPAVAELDACRGALFDADRIQETALDAQPAGTCELWVLKGTW